MFIYFAIAVSITLNICFISLFILEYKQNIKTHDVIGELAKIAIENQYIDNDDDEDDDLDDDDPDFPEGEDGWKYNLFDLADKE